MSFTPSLFGYMKQTQRFLRDGKTELIDPEDLVDYCNRSRREVAMRSQCLRYLPPISGSITGASIVAPGINYTAPTLAISAPDFPSGYGTYPGGLQATANATVTSGSITASAITQGGSGYFDPSITITDITGSGASIAPVLSWFNQTVQSQEVYPFSAVELPTGYDSIVAVKSVSIIYANYRYSLPQYSFSTYQAMIRQYPFQYEYVPTFCSQYGQGNAGSLYMYPLPTQGYQMEWDCFCLPADLTMASGDATDLIPLPWCEAVPHFMAYLAYLELQSFNNARLHQQLFDDFMHRYRGYASPGRATNPYGRW